MLSEDFTSATDGTSSNVDQDVGGDKTTLYRYFVEDRRTSGSLTLLRVSSLSDSDVLVEDKKRNNKKKIRRTNTFSNC